MMTPRDASREDLTNRKHQRPLSLPKRGLSRNEAAEYVGVSPSTFDEMVKDGLMPEAKKIYARRVWDLWQIDIAYSALPDANDRDDIWDSVKV